MKSCISCIHHSTCAELCPDAQRYSGQDYVSLRECYSTDPDFVWVASSCGWWPIQNAAYTPMSEFNFLKPIENRLLQAIYYEGLSYAESAKRFNRKVRAIESMLARVRKKIAVFYSM